METIRKTLAQVANDIEQGNASEYCNADFTHITVGQFEDFSAFLSYYNQHYKPLLERIENGEDITEEDRHLLNFLASDLLTAFNDEEDSDENE